jgi:Membrane bound O-acyl transferase family
LSMPFSSSIILSIFSNACLAHLVTALAWVFVPPSRLMRYPFFLITLVFLHRTIASARAIHGFGDQISTYLCGFALYSHYYLIVTRETAPPAKSSLEQLSNFAAIYFSPRKQLPASRIPSFRESDPDYVPSRQAFLFAGIRRVLVGLAAIYFQRNYILNVYVSDYGPPHDRLLARLLTSFYQTYNDNKITARECIIRAYTALTILAMEYNLHILVHASASIVGVGLLCQSPSQWRPIYGPLKEAYTVRRFYGTFYHSLMRNAFIGNAVWIVDFVLLWVSHSTIICRIISSRKSDIRRWLINLVALLICGIMHSVAIATANGCPRGAQMRYYLYIFLGMFAEDSTFWLCKRFYLRRLRWNRVGLYQRFLGYLWVFLFHCWMIPNSLYPGIYCDFKMQISIP